MKKTFIYTLLVGALLAVSCSDSDIANNGIPGAGEMNVPQVPEDAVEGEFLPLTMKPFEIKTVKVWY